MGDVLVHHPEGDEPIVWLVWNDGDYYGPNLVTAQPTREAAVAWLTAHLGTSEYYKVGETASFYVEGLAAGGIPVGYTDLLHESKPPDDAIMASWFAVRQAT